MQVTQSCGPEHARRDYKSLYRVIRRRPRDCSTLDNSPVPSGLEEFAPVFDVHSPTIGLCSRRCQQLRWSLGKNGMITNDSGVPSTRVGNRGNMSSRRYTWGGRRTIAVRNVAKQTKQKGAWLRYYCDSYVTYFVEPNKARCTKAHTLMHTHQYRELFSCVRWNTKE